MVFRLLLGCLVARPVDLDDQSPLIADEIGDEISEVIVNARASRQIL